MQPSAFGAQQPQVGFGSPFGQQQQQQQSSAGIFGVLPPYLSLPRLFVGIKWCGTDKQTEANGKVTRAQAITSHAIEYLLRSSSLLLSSENLALSTAVS